MAELRRQHPARSVELWAEDEARLGLKPIARRVWAVRGRRPTASGRTQYQWLYVYGFVRGADIPEVGEPGRGGQAAELVEPS